MSSGGHWLLDARTGPFRALPAFSASPEDRRAAHPRQEAHRILRALAAAGGLPALSSVLGQSATSPSTLQRRLAAAIEDRTLLFVPGWTWLRRRGPPGDRPISLPRAAVEVARGPRARKATFELVIIDVQTGQPLSGVTLEVEPPDGSTRRVDTDGQGSVKIPDLEPGACTVRSVIEEARVQSSYVPGPASAASAAQTGAPSTGPAFLVDAVRHRTATGQTPASIAKEWGVPWQEIALFNWGTAEARELERRYRKTLGCVHTAPNGTLVFDDGDDPGILLIPRPWETRLPVGSVHRVLVSPLRTVFLSVQNEAGLALPGVGYEAVFASGDRRSGRLGRAGIARLEGVPEGMFSVTYPDEGDILAKSMAASVRRALDEQSTAPLFTLLMQDRAIVEGAGAAYERYFNDLTGKGLAADIDQVVTDAEARRPLLALCAVAGLAVEGVGAVSVESFQELSIRPPPRST
jgi:hypothetical protein